MKQWRVIASILVFAMAMCGGDVMADQSQSIAAAVSSRGVRVEGTINAPLAEVWRVWTTSAGAEEFFAPRANIELAIGGPYEIYFDPHDERKSTKGLKVLAYAPQEMIAFQWNAPPDMPEIRNGGTWVVVQLRAAGDTRTHVTVAHLGWKSGPAWDQAYPHFVRGWNDLVERLKVRFNEGPIDWSREVETEDKAHFSLKERKPTRE